jgi:hypothetical protein
MSSFNASIWKTLKVSKDLSHDGEMHTVVVYESLGFNIESSSVFSYVRVRVQ